jgi:hypothetical protein
MECLPSPPRIKDIRIDKPCSENWQNMDSRSGARFCRSCRKEVFDFTDKTDADLQRLIAEQGNSICGRFRRSQINPRPLQADNRRAPLTDLFRKVAASAATLLIMYSAGQAANPADPLAHRMENHADPPQQKSVDPAKNTTVTGVVLADSIDNIPDDIAVVLVFEAESGKEKIEQKTKAGLFHFDLAGKTKPGSTVQLIVPRQVIKDGHSEHTYHKARQQFRLDAAQNVLVSTKVDGLWDDIIMGEIILDPDE